MINYSGRRSGIYEAIVGNKKERLKALDQQRISDGLEPS
jgi:hypothetical protein